VRLRSSIRRYAAERRYAQLFGRCINATDTERVVAHGLVGLLDRRERPLRVLDMGAGRGDISAILAETADVVDAVEPNRHHLRDLRSLADSNPRIRVAEGSIQDFRTDARYDLIALVYVVESIADSDLARHVERLLDLRKPGGRVVGVTYLDGCALDAFSSAVQHVIPFGRTDAVSRVFPRLRAGGLNVHNLDVVRSEFRASSVDELFDVLSFFYMQELGAYRRLRPVLSRELRQHVESDGEGVRLTVEDVLYEILPMAQQLRDGSGSRDETQAASTGCRLEEPRGLRRRLARICRHLGS
jgi:SAM-dependent methyltransferase